MNRLRAIAIALALSSAAPLASAAESKPTAAPSATATDLARVLVPKESWAAGVTQISQNVQRQLQSHPGSNLRYPADFPDKIRAEVERVVPYDEFVAMHARQLQSSFTEPELKDVLAFYRTPTGQKWQRDLGKSNQTVALETQRRFDQKMPDIMSKLGGMAQAPAGSGKAPAGHGKPAKGGAK